MIQELERLKNRYIQMAKSINAPSHLLYFYDKPQDLGYAHIEYINGVYHYVVTEKGIELKRRETKDENELLFWLIQELTSSMALEYEKNNRDESEDFRRKYFAKHLELLRSINSKWFEIERERINSVLEKNPFLDHKDTNFI